ncbi:hypothetical protein DV517_61800 [Streptomyces sp. S816]|uniref:hypothetical protein n=1 Tax=Streptomyces sp. S816 TaxID=2283197 RepID=UPI00109C5DDF|nr:hypothetical protein [Streptomyces sp. S816]TGZ14697.1 hypothetical protein DV517_61800 [Streptomyces sp. S816]
MNARPLLLIDVDGPLNPFAAPPHRRPEGYQTHRMRPTGWEQPWQLSLPVLLNPSHGPALQSLPFELIWCTAWAAEANEWIAPPLGLPELPVIIWPENVRTLASSYRKSEPAVFWKTATVVEYAAGRPFAWIDDDFTDLDREYVNAHHDGPALLHWVSPRIGLLQQDFDTLTTWAANLNTEGTAR